MTRDLDAADWTLSGLRPGDRIQVVAMHDPDAIPAGATGTVRRVTVVRGVTVEPYDQIDVAWDPPHAARALSVLWPEDVVRTLPPPPPDDDDCICEIPFTGMDPACSACDQSR